MHTVRVGNTTTTSKREHGQKSMAIELEQEREIETTTMSGEKKDSIQSFRQPWKHGKLIDLFGVPEITRDDLDIHEEIGRGKKSLVRRATWKKQKGDEPTNNIDVALKSHYDTDSYPNIAAYTFWEFCRYNDLKAVQGKLIPKLHFILRDEGKLMLGLELGKPVRRDEYESTRVKELYSDLQDTGWVQREGSFRYDNFAWMKNEDGSQRLVAIDIESFIPWFQGRNAYTNRSLVARVIANRELKFLDIPEISPTELEIPDIDKSFEWTSYKRPFRSSWFGEKVVVVPSDSDDLFTALHRLRSLRGKGKSYPRPLFLARERDGTILLGLQHPRIFSQRFLDQIIKDLFYFIPYCSDKMRIRELMSR
jgi:hypothetical protein